MGVLTANGREESHLLRVGGWWRQHGGQEGACGQGTAGELAATPSAQHRVHSRERRSAHLRAATRGGVARRHCSVDMRATLSWQLEEWGSPGD